MKTRKNISKRNRKITKRGGGDIINLRSATIKHETKGPNTFQVSTDGKNFTDYHFKTRNDVPVEIVYNDTPNKPEKLTLIIPPNNMPKTKVYQSERGLKYALTDAPKKPQGKMGSSSSREQAPGGASGAKASASTGGPPTLSKISNTGKLGEQSKKRASSGRPSSTTGRSRTSRQGQKVNPLEEKKNNF